MIDTNRTARIAAFDVDAQKGFTPLCPNELPVPGGHEIVGALNAMARYAALRVASKDAHSPNAIWVVETHAEMLQPTGLPNADLTWVRHCEVGTRGFESLDGLPAAHEYDFMVFKGVEAALHPYGACYHDLADTLSTGVIEHLRAREIDTVLVGGLALEFCVATTARQLRNAGFEVVLYLPATRALDAEQAAGAVLDLQAAGVRVAETEHELARIVRA
ncbi:isochorismatase family protein [Geopseudomonas aromaticivorans]